MMIDQIGRRTANILTPVIWFLIQKYWLFPTRVAAHFRAVTVKWSKLFQRWQNPVDHL